MIRAAILLAAAACAVPAFAQTADRVRAQAWSAGQQVAACHLAGDKKRLEAALLADPASGAFDDWAAQKDTTCTSANVQTRGDFYRYAVSEALFRRDYRRGTPASFASVPPLSHARGAVKTKAMASRKMRDEDNALQASAIKLSMLGECIVRNDPATSHALLAANAGTPDEMTALTNLMPSVEGCTRGQATKMAIDDLRGAVALNYVRLAKAAGGVR